MNKTLNRHKKKGFTLIELLVVIAILAVLTTFLAPKIMSLPDKANVTKVGADIHTISQALKMYKLDNGFYPSTEQGLMALVQKPSGEPEPMNWKPDGYLEGKEAPRDPWGTTYIYRNPGSGGEDFEILSLGADKREGGEGYNADISSVKM